MEEFVVTETMRRNGCVYRPGGVMCRPKDRRCKTCGWNPEVEKVRKAELVLPGEQKDV